MSYFSTISSADRVQFEGHDVLNIRPIQDPENKEVLHYCFSVEHPDRGAELRKFTPKEIPHLIEAELLVIERGYHSLARQMDRKIHGSQELYGATKKQRKRVDLMLFLAKRMAHYHLLGMPLNRAGVETIWADLEADYKQYQARVEYGTDKANSTQSLKPLPAPSTLLDYYLKYRKGNRNPNVFLRPKSRSQASDIEATEDFLFVMNILRDYARGAPDINDAEPTALASKAEIAERAVDTVEMENAERIKNGQSHLILRRCAKTYERWIGKYLDPFTVVLQREGLAAAKEKFGSKEMGRQATVPGENVQFDAWMFHIVTLDTTRARWNEMTAEERKNVKRVRRWVVAAIDVATRVILGYSICRNPNENASLEALRMCFMDKTYLLRNAGIYDSHWGHMCPFSMVSTDSGSEFGKHPFGGASFSSAVRRLGSSFMNTVAGVPELRGHIERWFLTVELKFARNFPGWTASNPQKLNDRKPHEEACVTDDELDAMFAAYIAQYHKTGHRGLNLRTPASMWDELTKQEQFDADQLPNPTALREACGFHADATISESGILYEGIAYSNEFIRNQRTARAADRIAKHGEAVEIIIDPFDLGGVSLLTGGDVISIPALDSRMRGKTLRQWRLERVEQRFQAKMDIEQSKPQKDEARGTWKEILTGAMKTHDTGMFGYTATEVQSAVRESDFGKGAHEKPYVGQLEYEDPIYSGVEIGDGYSSSGDEEQTEVAPDEKNSMDRYRSKAKPRMSGKSRENGK
jgi:transposase InsO family protein